MFKLKLFQTPVPLLLLVRPAEYLLGNYLKPAGFFNFLSESLSSFFLHLILIPNTRRFPVRHYNSFRKSGGPGRAAHGGTFLYIFSSVELIALAPIIRFIRIGFKPLRCFRSPENTIYIVFEISKFERRKKKMKKRKNENEERKKSKTERKRGKCRRKA